MTLTTLIAAIFLALVYLKTHGKEYILDQEKLNFAVLFIVLSITVLAAKEIISVFFSTRSGSGFRQIASVLTYSFIAFSMHNTFKSLKEKKD